MALKPGKHLAKIVDCGLLKGKNGPVSALVFRSKDEHGNPVDMTWFGSFQGGAKEITLRTLVQCGSKATSSAELSGELNRYQGEGQELKPIAFNTKDDFEIDVKLEPNPQKNNALEARIAWVNLPGGSGFRKTMSQGESAALLGGISLGADLLSARQKAGVKAPEPAQDDILF